MSKSAAEKLLSWMLMIIGCGLMVAFLFVLLSGKQMAAIHAWLGMGEMPNTPITFYLARSTSLLYGVHGFLMFVCGKDIKKYIDLVPIFGWLHVMLGLVMLGIDWSSGMPWWWTTFEGVPIAMTGGFIVWLARKATSRV